MSILKVVQQPKQFEDFTSRNGTADIFQKVSDLEALLRESTPKYLDGLGLQILTPAAPRVTIREKDDHAHEVIMLASNSYLSMTTHPRVIAACKAACDNYGYGMGASPLLAGTSALHRQLEKLIAEFYETEDAMIFPCGYSGNVGIIAALCGPGDVVLTDAANHASIFDGCRLSGAEVKVFLHRNLEHLEKTLKNLPESQKGRLIVTCGVFSMNGDIAPLDQIVDLAERYQARVMIDEAHALGVVGPNGRGTAEKFNCMDKVDIIFGTLSKAPGAIGGYCAGAASLIRYLRYYARPYFFSTSSPPPIVAGVIEVFKLLMKDAAGRDRLWDNISYMLAGLKKLGFDTGNTESAIIPIMIGHEGKLANLHNDLRHQGVFTNLVTYPAVRRKECRLRVSIMNSLTRVEMDKALGIFAELGREYGVI
jgi:glycine C-acetyltransferase